VARIPLDQVSALGVRRFSRGRTTLLIVAIPAGVYGFALLGCAATECGF
jgi:hypothetical protein